MSMECIDRHRNMLQKGKGKQFECWRDIKMAEEG